MAILAKIRTSSRSPGGAVVGTQSITAAKLTESVTLDFTPVAVFAQGTDATAGNQYSVDIAAAVVTFTRATSTAADTISYFAVG